MSYVIKCDRCSKMGSEMDGMHLPQQWNSISMTVSTIGGTRNKRHQFCQDCSEYLGIGSKSPAEETSADRLIAVLEAVIDKAVTERLEDVDA